MSSGVCSVSKTETQISSYCNFMQIKVIGLTLKNMVFNRSLFVKSETAIEFVALKRV